MLWLRSTPQEYFPAALEAFPDLGRQRCPRTAGQGAAVARTKMAPAAWLAKLGTDAAGGGQAGGRALAGDVADAAADMSDATEVARRIGHLFNQAVAKLHALGEVSVTGNADSVSHPARRASCSAANSPARSRRLASSF